MAGVRVGRSPGQTTPSTAAPRRPPRERVVTAEEVSDLKVPLPDVVSMQCRQPNLEGTGEIKLRRLLKRLVATQPVALYSSLQDA